LAGIHHHDLMISTERDGKRHAQLL
jgi:hypothetical protein